jgi:hypothetical protein
MDRRRPRELVRRRIARHLADQDEALGRLVRGRLLAREKELTSGAGEVGWAAAGG